MRRVEFVRPIEELDWEGRGVLSPFQWSVTDTAVLCNGYLTTSAGKYLQIVSTSPLKESCSLMNSSSICIRVGSVILCSGFGLSWVRHRCLLHRIHRCWLRVSLTWIGARLCG